MPAKSSTTKILGHQWRVDHIWNESLETIPERPLVKREYMWASELGGSYIDRYLKMNAHPMTNPPNPRSKRKFSAGHIWEWIIGFVLTSSGLLKERQLRTMVELPGLLPVSGKLDYIAGGIVDWDKVEYDVKQLRKLMEASISEMPPIVSHAIDNIITKFKQKFGTNPLEEVILEAKSVSSFMSAKLQKTNEAMDHHVLQNLHYVIPNKLPGALLYTCKDDCIMNQFRVETSPGLTKLYKKDVATMTEYITGANKKDYMKSLPPKEPQVLFDPDMNRFSMNFRVEYSPYLTMLYEYKTPELYRLRWQSTVTAWNRVFKKLATGGKITPDNQKKMDQMDDAFPDWEKYMLKAKKSGFFDKKEEGGEDE